jgi:hypothetical protein
MWLLDANTFDLRQIIDANSQTQNGIVAPQYQYAVLSHRWEEDGEEATFEEFINTRPSFDKKGTRKIRECCRIAKDNDIDLIWSDTCQSFSSSFS